MVLIRNMHNGFEMWADELMLGRSVETSTGGIALMPEDWPSCCDDGNNEWEILREAD